MNEQSNVPMSPAPNNASSFFQVWMNALTKPNEQTYADIAASPHANPGKAYMWIFITALVNFGIAVGIQALFMGLSGGGQDTGFQSLLGGSVLSLICGVPLLAGLEVLAFMIITGLVQWVAGIFKGTGTYNQLAYVFGAIWAPILLISSVLSLFSAIPFLGLCLLPVSIVLLLYVTVLSIIGVKGVNKFDWGQAVASYMLPVLVLVIIMICLLPIITIAVMTTLGFKVNDTFNSIGTSVP